MIKFLLIVSIVLLAGCANLQTIDRTTSFSSSTEKKGTLRAIHLDAQQRLILTNQINRICAEPSPDALAAYASSLGFGLSAPTQGSASLAQSLQNSSGSIGLRTQSITLMRDTLYRMCEAWMNEAIGPVQVATFLGRSLDLTAVILAVEQLTGAVAAKQIVLTGASGAGGSAAILSNQELLDAAREDEQGKAKLLEESQTALQNNKEAVAIKTTEVSEARTAYNDAIAPGSSVPSSRQSELKTDLNKKESELASLNTQQETLESETSIRSRLLEESQKNRKTIEDIKNSAVANAISNTNTSGQFGAPIQIKQLSAEATREISTAVKEMVTRVLDKKYTEAACVALLSNDSEKLYGKLDEVMNLCVKLITKNLELEANRTSRY